MPEKAEQTVNRKLWLRTLCSTISILIVIAAIAVLLSTYIFPVLRIHGSSMNPTLEAGDTVLCLKNADYKVGDVIAFYYENKILVKRVIASAGQQIEIDEEGRVSVDGEPLEEPYVQEYALGICDRDFPYEVPENEVFVMGDERSSSVDSRSTTIGCVKQEQVVGKLLFRVLPLGKIGRIR